MQWEKLTTDEFDLAVRTKGMGVFAMLPWVLWGWWKVN